MRAALIASRVRRVASLGRPVLAFDEGQGSLAVVTDRVIALLDARLRVVHRLHPPGRFVGVGGGDAIYQTARGLELRRLQDGRLDHLVPLRRPSRVELAALDPGRKLVTVAGRGARVEILDTGTGRLRLELTQCSPVTAVPL